MDSLRDRFQTLGSIPVPDLWPEIERRVASSLVPASGSTAWRRQRRQTSFGAAAMVLAAAILAVVATGVIVVGAGWLQRLQAPVGPTPTASSVTRPLGSQPATTPDLATEPSSPDAAACPGAADEADAQSTYLAGTSVADRGWADDGKAAFTGRLAGFADGGQAIWLLDPSTGATCRLVQLAKDLWVQGSPQTTLAWSPTGDALAIGGPSPTLGRLLIWSPGSIRTVWIGNDGPVVAWAPNGTALAAMPAGIRWGGIVAADGSPDQDVDGAPHRLAWSPSGASIAMQPMEPIQGEFPYGQIWTWSQGRGDVGIEDGGLRPILVGWQDEATLIAIDGDRLVAFPVADPGRVRELTRVSRDLQQRFMGGEAHVSADLRHAAYAAGADVEAGQLRIANLIDGTEVTVSAVARGVLMTWSPDGRQLAFDDADNRLWIVNADGTGLRLLTDNAFLVLDGSWQPQ